MKEFVSKSKVLGQYFTKKSKIKTFLELLKPFIKNKNISILEPSKGTGNFIKVLKENGFKNIDECEIDPELTNEPKDFLKENSKIYDMIIGNPPFTKYNLPESYYKIKGDEEFIKFKKEKERIENIFILKSIQQTNILGFVLPISFWIKNRNKIIKEEIQKKFNTIIIYQDDDIWFDYNIPCCFTIMTNTNKPRIELIYNKRKIISNNIFDELIPKTIIEKPKQTGKTPLRNLIEDVKVKYKRSYTENNISAKNILDFKKGNYLAVVRVGNSSVGKSGLIDIEKDILNGMFYVFKLKKGVNSTEIINKINNNQKYFKSISFRVGSKSIKREDILNFRI